MRKNSVMNISETRIGIIGDNILYNGPVITAYYILPMANYSVTSPRGRLNNIEGLTNLLGGLANDRPGLKFSIQRCSKTIKAEDVRKNLLETIKLYRPDYDMPEEFTSHIDDVYQDYCLLAVDIQQSDVINADSYSTKETIKEVFSSISNKLLASGNDNIDIPRVVAIEDNIYMTLKSRCVRATKELTFYQYISKLYPSYEISYESNSYFNDEHFSDILGVVNQTVEDNFGYFVMHNEGVGFFDYDQMDTYGCILNIRSFPGSILAENFPLNVYGLQVNVETLPKDKAEIQLKRRRAAARYKVDEAIEAGEEPEGIQKAAEVVDLTTLALQDLDERETICKFNANILVLGTSVADLADNANQIISKLRDRNLVVAKSLNQAQDFINNFVRLAPQKMNHMVNLEYVLSFQQNYGANVGQFDSFYKNTGKKLAIPAIGEDI